MDDAPAIAAEVVVVVEKVRADRGKGLAGGAGVHGSSRGRGGRRQRHRATIALVAEGICETSPVNIADTIDGAKRAFERAGRGCLVRIGGDEPRYATVTRENSHGIPAGSRLRMTVSA